MCVCVYANVLTCTLVFWSIPEPTVNLTSTSVITPVPTTMNSSVQSQTSLATTVSSTLVNFSITETTLKPSLSPGNVSSPPYNITSSVITPTETYTSLSSTPRTIKVGELGQKWQIVPLLHVCTTSLPHNLPSSQQVGFGFVGTSMENMELKYCWKGPKGEGGQSRVAGLICAMGIAFLRCRE